ncbi:hypothetical protein PHLGIDRAFT_98529 [Phlebiopsis gigantea 11061_1 CR5-6]|uniref:G-patch domain-containing protein n=1 Tax=Phlebiopsis gigantea (strain 11061_1 CR5-6) TaxID=745531 RepID=A0A0C3PW30_PHLG1|nr:hypothetical protein PHLGIDRAFT_98529 [Phlebiopsis gigantea 11061_1 CR5-6]
MSRIQQLAIIDGYTQVQFGRDAAPPSTDTPRIRLKEMEVSKLHATVYWDAAKKSWAVVDMGSKHGTFIRPRQIVAEPVKPTPNTGSNSSSHGTDLRGHRLSAPRMSSMPRVLRHLDELSLGNTTFIAHLHEDRLPCEACVSKGGDEIPLFYVSKAQRQEEALRKRKLEALDPPPPPPGDAKKSLNMLKRSMLSRHGNPVDRRSEETHAYVDRSAKRRALHPGTPDMVVAAARASISAPSSRPISPPPPEPTSAPPVPLASTNIGHRLLLKQGWMPGTALGQERSELDSGSTALVEPI